MVSRPYRQVPPPSSRHEALSTGRVTIVLRRRRPDLVQPYRTPGYPFVPLVFIAGTLLVVTTALVEHPVTTLVGIGLTLLGVPLAKGGDQARWGRARMRDVTAFGQLMGKA